MPQALLILQINLLCCQLVLLVIVFDENLVNLYSQGMLQRQPCGVSIKNDLTLESYQVFIKYDNQQDQLTAQQVNLEDG